MLHHPQHRGIPGHPKTTQKLANHCLLRLLSHRARHAHDLICLSLTVLLRYCSSQGALGDFQVGARLVLGKG